MFVAGVVATASLVATLIVLAAAGVLLAYVDKFQDKHREHY